MECHTERSCESGLHNGVRSKKDIQQEAILCRRIGEQSSLLSSAVVCALVISCDSSAERPARVLVNSKTENGNGCRISFSFKNNFRSATTTTSREMFVALTCVIVVDEAHREEIIFEKISRNYAHPVGLKFHLGDEGDLVQLCA